MCLGGVWGLAGGKGSSFVHMGLFFEDSIGISESVSPTPLWDQHRVPVCLLCLHIDEWDRHNTNLHLFPPVPYHYQAILCWYDGSWTPCYGQTTFVCLQCFDIDERDRDRRS